LAKYKSRGFNIWLPKFNEKKINSDEIINYFLNFVIEDDLIYKEEDEFLELKFEKWARHFKKDFISK
jgi:hypothetical protein